MFTRALHIYMIGEHVCDKIRLHHFHFIKQPRASDHAAMPLLRYTLGCLLNIQREDPALHSSRGSLLTTSTALESILPALLFVP
jgi:hypothetical protein